MKFLKTKHLSDLFQSLKIYDQWAGSTTREHTGNTTVMINGFFFTETDEKNYNLKSIMQISDPSKN